MKRAPKRLALLLVLLATAQASESDRSLVAASEGGSDEEVSGNLFFDSLFGMDICHSLSETQYKTERVFFIWAFIRILFFGDRAGTCGRLCANLCDANQCKSFLIDDQAGTCTCAGSVCDTNAVCEASICLCNDGYDGNGQICCDTKEYNYVKGSDGTASCSILTSQELAVFEEMSDASVDDIDKYMLENGDAVPEAQTFISLVRERIPTQMAIIPTDREILQAIMIPRPTAERRLLFPDMYIELQDLSSQFEKVSAVVPYQRGLNDVQECEDALKGGIGEVIGLVLTIIGFGKADTIMIRIVDGILLKMSIKFSLLLAVIRAIPKGQYGVQVFDALFKVVVGLFAQLGWQGVKLVLQKEVKGRDFWVMIVFAAAEIAAMMIVPASLTIKIAVIAVKLVVLAEKVSTAVLECSDVDTDPVITLPPTPLPPHSCTDGLNSGTCELVEAGTCPGAQQLRNQDLLTPCDAGVCCARGETLNCVAAGGRSGTCLGDVEKCQEGSGSPSLLVPTQVGPCNNCCLKEGVLCTTNERDLLGTCIEKARTDCPLPLPSDDCSLLGVSADLTCCVRLTQEECGYGFYQGACTDKAYCGNQGGISIAGLCLGGDNIQCCLKDSLPECVSYSRYPGECSTATDCNQMRKTPLRGFETLEHACPSALSCCVEPPTCASSGNGSRAVSGTCLDISVCAEYEFEPVSDLCKGNDNIQCCLDLRDFACSKDGIPGKCMDKDSCSGKWRIPVPLAGCPGSSEINCCVDFSCKVAETDGQCLPADQCAQLPALSWHNCPSGLSCCIPSLYCGGYAADGLWVEGECQTACASTAYPVIPPDSDTEYCPDGLLCCIHGVSGCKVAEIHGECRPAVECPGLPALSWHNCPEGDSCCIPPGLVCFADNQGGECKVSCNSSTESPAEGSNYCPGGLVCCLPMNNGSSFTIVLDLLVPEEDHEAFETVTSRLQSVVTSDLADFDPSHLGPPPSGCSYPDGWIDDLYVCCSYEEIDGNGTESGNILGYGGPTYIRTDGYMPITGEIVLDASDVEWMLDEGLLESAITHEMLHVLGFGTLWERKGLVGSDPDNCQYLGAVATAEFQILGGCETMPIDEVCAHWSETCFQTEVMTPFVNPGSNPLSRLTIGGLEDLGYEVDYAMADQFTVNDLNSAATGCVCNPQRQLRDVGYTKVLGDSRLPRRIDSEVYSNDLRNYAVSKGLSLLGEADVSEGRFADPGRATFVGNQVVSVMVEENHQIFVVVVQRPQH